MKNKVILIILDGLGYTTARNYLGSLEGWVEEGEAQVWKMRSALPSISGPCYVSIHTGLTPQVHLVTTNHQLDKIQHPDIFSVVRQAGGKTGAVTHSDFSSFFQRSPFDIFRDLDVDDETLPIQHGHFYSVTGESHANPVVPSDPDLFARAMRITEQHDVDYLLIHSLTVDALSHRYGPDSAEMDHTTHVIDDTLSRIIPKWRAMGYDLMITADHGHSPRGHHGGTTPEMRDIAFYYFGAATGPNSEVTLKQTAIMPSVLTLMGLNIPPGCKSPSFF